MHNISSKIKRSKASSNSFLKLNAFTLAEVLITLGIIGVVASLTIPTLMNNIQEQQYKVAWKKAFTIFSQATQQITNDNGGSMVGLFSSNQDIVTVYSQYLKNAKICTDSIGEKCRSAVIGSYSSPTTNVDSNGPGLITVDGMFFEPWVSDKNCKSGVNTPVAFYRCGGAIVDVNGVKPPNVEGRDVFVFNILENRILPYGTQGDFFYPPENDCQPGGSGEGCSALYLLNK
jgi:prepilin-type N-terminal cleavage/methylation domain-containing protein